MLGDGAGRRAPHAVLVPVECAALAACYLVVARLGMSLAALPGNVAPVWPATGLATSWLLLRGRDRWPGVAVGAFAANALGPLGASTAIGMATGNALEAVLGAWLLRRLCDGLPELRRVPDVLALLGTSLSAAVPSATLGVASLWRAGVPDGVVQSWLVWWVGDVLGALLVLPLALTWLRRPPRGRVLVETLLLSAGAGVVCGIVYAEGFERPYAFFPILVMAGLRVGPAGTSLVVGVVAAESIAGTVAGRGAFALGSRAHSLWLLDSSLAVVALTGLLLAAVVGERDEMAKRLRTLMAEERENREQAELSLVAARADAQRVLRSTFESAPCGVAALDLEGRYLAVNDALCALTGYAAEELIGLSFVDITVDDDRALAHEQMRQLLDRETAHYRGEKRYLRKDGRVQWVEVNATLVIDQDGHPTHFVGQFFDIADRRAAAAARDEANEHLLHAAEMKDHFLAVTTHELRTPLTSIIGFAQTLQRAWQALPDGEREECLGAVVANGRRLQGMVDDLLTLSSMQAGRLALRLSAVDLGALLRDVVAESGLGCSVDCPPISLVADEQRLRQLVANLLTNAGKYGAAPYSVSVVGERDGVAIVVEDRGPGVPADFVPRLFEPFSQASTGQTRTASGAGLGLSIVSQLAQAHGGAVSYADRSGGGASFRVRLPLQPLVPVQRTSVTSVTA